MNKVNEMFGRYTNGSQFPDLHTALRTQSCPFKNGGKCYKTRKSDPDTAIGTCSLCFDNVEQPLLICPEPLTKDHKIFNDCLPFIADSIPGSDLYLVPEVKVADSRIDYVLVAIRNNCPINFVGIELQTLDTTGSIWNSRQKLLLDHGYPVNEGEARSNGAGVNWKMTSKTILGQLLQKSEIFANMNRNLVLVCQTPLFLYMQRSYNFKELRVSDQRDVLHFHVYDYIAVNDEMSLQLSDRKSASLEVVRAMMRNPEENNPDLLSINETLMRRLRPEYKFEVF